MAKICKGRHNYARDNITMKWKTKIADNDIWFWLWIWLWFWINKKETSPKGEAKKKIFFDPLPQRKKRVFIKMTSFTGIHALFLHRTWKWHPSYRKLPWKDNKQTPIAKRGISSYTRTSCACRHNWTTRNWPDSSGTSIATSKAASCQRRSKVVPWTSSSMNGGCATRPTRSGMRKWVQK